MKFQHEKKTKKTTKTKQLSPSTTRFPRSYRGAVQKNRTVCEHNNNTNIQSVFTLPLHCYRTLNLTHWTLRSVPGCSFRCTRSVLSKKNKQTPQHSAHKESQTHSTVVSHSGQTGNKLQLRVELRTTKCKYYKSN